MTSTETQTLGMVGVGLLGSAMARRWLEAGQAVLAYDTDPSKLGWIAQSGGMAATSARDLVRQCDPIVFCLPDSHVVTQVISQLEPYEMTGQTIIDTTTGSPSTTERLARRLAARGVAWLDATVAGSSELMSRGQAVLLVGGDRPVFERYRRLLGLLSPEVFWLGPSGSGAKMKLVVNLAIGLHRAVLAETLALAASMDFDLTQTLDVLRATPAYSRVMDSKGEKMIHREFTPQARLSQHLKDVRLIVEEGERRGQPLPLSTLHQTILQHCVEVGDGDLDNSAVVRAWFQP